jgi:hypothetical protein
VRRFSNRPLDVELLRVLEGSPDEATLLRYVSAGNDGTNARSNAR